MRRLLKFARILILGIIGSAIFGVYIALCTYSLWFMLPLWVAIVIVIGMLIDMFLCER